jgi:hypothetical protein
MNPVQPPPPMTYQHLKAENEYLKHNMAYTNQIAWHNQATAQANYHDAQRWRKFKEMLDAKHGSTEQSTDLQARIDAALKGPVQ